MTREELIQENKELKKTIKELEEKIRLFEQLLFGKKTEKHIIEDNVNQLSLFNDSKLDQLSEDVEYDEVVKETRIRVVRHHCKKDESSKRKAYLDGLEQVEDVNELSEQDLICPDCQNKMEKIGKRLTSREVELKPAEIYCVNHVVETAKCTHCHPMGGDKLISADSPQPLFPHSYYSSSVLTEILVNKYVLAIPLHRQQKIWQRLKLPITTKSMANAVINGAIRFLEPIYSQLVNGLRKENVIHMDETPFRVLEGDKDISYFWTAKSTKEFNHHDITLFHYSETRSGKNVEDIVGDNFSGTILCDGYPGYSNNLLPKQSFGTCFVHIRRPFAQLSKINSKFGSSKSDQILKLMGEVFHVERNLKYSSLDEKLKLRNEHLKPKLDAVYDYILGIKNPMGKLKDAIHNALRLKSRLYKIFENAQLPLDNNPVEQSIRPTTLVRKNSLFAKSQNGAKANAIIYSIIATAKQNNLKIFDYLKYVFDQYTKRVLPKVEDLLPWNENIQSKFHV